MVKNFKEISYWEIFKKAGKLTWENRYLWWFGFFVSLSAIINFNFYSQHQEKTGYLSNSGHFVSSLHSHFSSIGVVGIIIILIIYLVIMAIGIIGRGALISSLNKINQGKTLDFKLGIKEGRKYFWKIFWIAFLITGGVLIMILIIITPIILLFLNQAYLIGSLMGFLAFLIILLLSIVAVFLKIYGYLYVILGELSFLEAINNAYNLFRKNLAISLMVGLLFLGITILWMIILMLFLVPIVLIFFGFSSVLFLIIGKIGILISFLMGGSVLIAIILFFKSLYTVFAQTVWVLLFQEIAKPEEDIMNNELETEFGSLDKSTAAVTSMEK